MGAIRIKATPEIKGEFARQIIREIQAKPSPKAIERNKRAYELLLKLRKS